MYPWKEALTSWAHSFNLRIDALGLVTILGADEVNIAVGRLVSSRYVEFLPLLGAFMLSSNRFTEKQSGFTLYGLKSGTVTTELAGWFSRWLKMQDFHQVHHRVSWDVLEELEQNSARFWTALAVGIPCNGMLVALTILSGDWWGFANAIAMIVSVIVRSVLVQQNRAGIDNAIKQANSAPDDKENKYPGQREKALVIMDDSRVITIDAPAKLIGRIFAAKPQVPNRSIYNLMRWIGWAGFGIHIVSIGMATLPTQIYTIILMLVPTVLTVFKFGCDDWKMENRITKKIEKQKQNGGATSNFEVSCWITGSLRAVCSEYPIEYESPNAEGYSDHASREDHDGRMTTCRDRANSDVEACEDNTDSNRPSNEQLKRTTRRQDLYVWLNLTADELDTMKAWNLVPRQNGKWWDDYWEKKEQHNKRLGDQRTTATATLNPEPKV